ncbi:MAG: hypothetical protein HN704_12690 [Bacteroidetes bacterium]|nr:hypothetical protein [Bacteroidota bacterium]MBT6835523.1 hypothetical protein [Bacteroidota bacterium]MBT7144876.1 hypothetical protein [Bacteroidota bacterium]MBT7492451.1 hypothetical protein [Bacteroidota bacterium]
MKRFINFLIDTVSILILFFLSLKALLFILELSNYDFNLDINIILILLYVIYYMVFEGITGRSFGKYLTHTKVVSSNNNRPTFMQIFIRTLVRLIFIEVISFLSKNPNGWHDKLSNTKVIEF